MDFKQLLNLGKDVILAKVFKRNVPFRVKYNITYKCNLACPFCLLKKELNKAQGRQMNTPQIKKMMGEFKTMGTRLWLFSGGEPLLSDNLNELIGYAKEQMKFCCGIATNGILLAEKIRNDPSLKLLDFIQISLEGPKDIQDALRGFGTYEKVILALDVLMKLNIKAKVIIMVLISKYNVNHLRPLIRLASQYNAGIVFQAIGRLPSAYSGLEDDFSVPKDIFKEAINELIKEKKNNPHIVSSFEYLNMLKDFWPDVAHQIRCYANRFYCEVTPDGFVFPCCAKLEYENVCLNGVEIGFKKAFLNLPDMTRCRDCYYAGSQELNLMFQMSALSALALYKGHIFRNNLRK